MTDDELSYEIRGAIFEVYNQLGPGLMEHLYECALMKELELRGIRAEHQIKVPVVYKGIEVDDALRLDVLVEGRIIVEIKSVSELQSVHFKQLITYLRLMDLEQGILVNFDANNIIESTRRVYKGNYSHG
jgi:GxxExxY protein